MIEVPIYNQTGQEVEKLQVDEEKLGGYVRAALLKQAVGYYHANQRQGTSQTKNRGSVEGSTKKIYKQKGTGNARMGPVRNPVRVGGGHAKQKLHKDWRQDLPKKARRVARNSAVLTKLRAGDIKIVDKITLESPKTKLMAEVYKALGLDRSVLIALGTTGEANASIARAARNIDRTTISSVSQLNAWEILRRKTLLITKEGFEELLG